MTHDPPAALIGTVTVDPETKLKTVCVRHAAGPVFMRVVHTSPRGVLTCEFHGNTYTFSPVTMRLQRVKGGAP